MVNTNVMAKVVTAILLNLDTFDGESTCRVALLAAPVDAQKEAGTKIGRKFFLMNRRALGTRYGRGGHLRLPDFVFESWADATPVEQFKAMCCLLYQCCEGKVPDSRLYDELNSAAGQLAQAIVQDLPEYDKASWGAEPPPRSLCSSVGGWWRREHATLLKGDLLMGQYHHPVCIEAEEGLNPSGMDGGLKEGEQGFRDHRTRLRPRRQYASRLLAVAADRPLGGNTRSGPRRLCRGQRYPGLEGPEAFEALPRHDAGRGAQAQEKLGHNSKTSRSPELSSRYGTV
jgi:hypothetical protein